MGIHSFIYGYELQRKIQKKKKKNEKQQEEQTILKITWIIFLINFNGMKKVTNY